MLAKLSAFLLSLCLCGSVKASRDLLVSNVATHSILRFDGATGAPKGDFVKPGAGGLIAPKQMALGPDGNLYVADFEANVVKRFHIGSGEFMGDFTPPGDTLAPIALKFFDDGVRGVRLFVLGGSTAQRELRRYSAAAGTFESIVISANSSQYGAGRDFIFMTPSNDPIIVGTNNRGIRYAFSSGSVVNAFLNGSGISSGATAKTCKPSKTQDIQVFEGIQVFHNQKLGKGLYFQPGTAMRRS